MIQTWLPLPSFKESIQALSDEHLGLQRLHVLQIIETLHEVEVSELPKDYDVSDNPELACNMWNGYELQLIEYGLEACDEWSARIGKRDKVYGILAQHLDWATSDTANMGKPPWFGDVNFHISHQAALVRLDPDHYRRYFLANTEHELVWPDSGYDG